MTAGAFGLPVAPSNIWAALTAGLLGNPDEGIRQLYVHSGHRGDGSGPGGREGEAGSAVTPQTPAAGLCPATSQPLNSASEPRRAPPGSAD